MHDAPAYDQVEGGIFEWQLVDVGLDEARPGHIPESLLRDIDGRGNVRTDPLARCGARCDVDRGVVPGRASRIEDASAVSEDAPEFIESPQAVPLDLGALVQCINARVLIATSNGPFEAKAFRDLLLSGFAGADESRNTPADRISNSVGASQLAADHLTTPFGLGRGDGERAAPDRVDEYLDERGAH